MDLLDFYDKHRNKMCFIIGAGPSLHFEKLQNIEKYVTFTVNSGILKYRSCDYFVTDDIGVTDWDYYFNACQRSNSIKFLYKDKLEHYGDHFREKAVWFKHKCWYDSITRTKNPEGLKITKDPEKPLIGARTSMGTAVHIAYIMGCDPIVLLGCDCCYHDEKEYFWQFPGEHKPHRLKGASLPTRKQLMNRKVVDIDNIEFIDYWNNLAKLNPHVNVINASTNGLLDAFPKLGYPDILKRFGEKVK